MNEEKKKWNQTSIWFLGSMHDHPITSFSNAQFEDLMILTTNSRNRTEDIKNFTVQQNQQLHSIKSIIQN